MWLGIHTYIHTYIQAFPMWLAANANVSFRTVAGSSTGAALGSGLGSWSGSGLGLGLGLFKDCGRGRAQMLPRCGAPRRLAGLGLGLGLG